MTRLCICYNEPWWRTRYRLVCSMTLRRLARLRYGQRARPMVRQTRLSTDKPMPRFDAASCTCRSQRVTQAVQQDCYKTRSRAIQCPGADGSSCELQMPQRASDPDPAAVLVRHCLQGMRVLDVLQCHNTRSNLFGCYAPGSAYRSSRLP